MLAKAIENGFYNGKRVRKGEVFEAQDGAKSKWFVKVEGKKEAPKQAESADKKVVDTKAPAKGNKEPEVKAHEVPVV